MARHTLTFHKAISQALWKEPQDFQKRPSTYTHRLEPSTSQSSVSHSTSRRNLTFPLFSPLLPTKIYLSYSGSMRSSLHNSSAKNSWNESEYKSTGNFPSLLSGQQGNNFQAKNKTKKCLQGTSLNRSTLSCTLPVISCYRSGNYT